MSLVFLLWTASWFAFYHSNASYTSDEVWSIKATTQDYSSTMKALKADLHPPLFYQILFGWNRLIGSGERAGRSLSGLFYILSALSMYGLGRTLYGSKTALLCATIYVCSPLAILSAQFVRMYALLSLLSILSTWLYLQFTIKPSNSYLRFALYVLVNILGTFTHIGFFFVLFGQVSLQFLFFRRTPTRKFIAAIGVSLVPYLLLWAPVLLVQITKSREGLAWIKRPGIYEIAELFLLYGGTFWLLLPFLIYIWWRTGSEAFSAFSKLGKKALPLWLLTITLGTPLLLSAARPIFNYRLAIVGLHFFALVTGAIIGNRAHFSLSLALVALTTIGLFFLHTPTSSCDNRSVAHYLSNTVTDGDMIVFTSLTRMPVDYYLTQSHTPMTFFEISFPSEIDRHPGYEGNVGDPSRREALETEAGELIKVLSARSAHGSRVFVFHGPNPQINSILEAHLQKDFRLLSTEGLRCNDFSPYLNQIKVYEFLR